MKSNLFITFFIVFYLVFLSVTPLFAESNKQKNEISYDSPSVIDALEFPSNIAKIREMYNPEKAGSNATVFHIQDAHCNPQAQRNIRKIIENLMSQYDIQFVGIEGAEGNIDFDLFRKGTKENRERVCNSFIEKGMLTGTEALGICSDIPFQLYGLENKEIYLKNFISLIDTISKRNENEKFLDEIQKTLDFLKIKILVSKELITFDQKFQAFLNEQIKRTEYICFLNEWLERNKAIRDSLSLNESFPNLIKAFLSSVLEKSIDFEEIKKEQSSISELAGKLPQNEKEIYNSKENSFKESRLSKLSFYSYLLNITEKYQVNNPLINLKKYVEVLQIFKTVRTEKLIGEIRDISHEIELKLCKNSEEKDLVEYTKVIQIFKRLLDLKLTREELRYYKAHKELFPLKKIISWIKQKSEAYEKPIPEILETEPVSIDFCLKSAEDYYHDLIKRDFILAENFLTKMEEEGYEKGIIITGGFHSEGLVDYFQELQTTYAVITPIVGKPTDLYYEIMANSRQAVDTVLENSYFGLSPPLITDLNSGLISYRLLDDFLKELDSGKHANETISASFDFKNLNIIQRQDIKSKVEKILSKEGISQELKNFLQTLFIQTGSSNLDAFRRIRPDMKIQETIVTSEDKTEVSTDLISGMQTKLVTCLEEFGLKTDAKEISDFLQNVKFFNARIQDDNLAFNMKEKDGAYSVFIDSDLTFFNEYHEEAILNQMLNVYFKKMKSKTVREAHILASAVYSAYYYKMFKTITPFHRYELLQYESKDMQNLYDLIKENRAPHKLVIESLNSPSLNLGYENYENTYRSLMKKRLCRFIEEKTGLASKNDEEMIFSEKKFGVILKRQRKDYILKSINHNHIEFNLPFELPVPQVTQGTDGTDKKLLQAKSFDADSSGSYKSKVMTDEGYKSDDEYTVMDKISDKNEELKSQIYSIFKNKQMEKLYSTFACLYANGKMVPRVKEGTTVEEILFHNKTKADSASTEEDNHAEIQKNLDLIIDYLKKDETNPLYDLAKLKLEKYGEGTRVQHDKFNHAECVILSSPVWQNLTKALIDNFEAIVDGKTPKKLGIALNNSCCSGCTQYLSAFLYDFWDQIYANYNGKRPEWKWKNFEDARKEFRHLINFEISFVNHYNPEDTTGYLFKCLEDMGWTVVVNNNGKDVNVEEAKASQNKSIIQLLIEKRKLNDNLQNLQSIYETNPSLIRSLRSDLKANTVYKTFFEELIARIESGKKLDLKDFKLKNFSSEEEVAELTKVYAEFNKIVSSHKNDFTPIDNSPKDFLIQTESVASDVAKPLDVKAPETVKKGKVKSTTVSPLSSSVDLKKKDISAEMEQDQMSSASFKTDIKETPQQDSASVRYNYEAELKIIDSIRTAKTRQQLHDKALEYINALHMEESEKQAAIAEIGGHLKKRAYAKLYDCAKKYLVKLNTFGFIGANTGIAKILQDKEKKYLEITEKDLAPYKTEIVKTIDDDEKVLDSVKEKIKLRLKDAKTKEFLKKYYTQDSEIEDSLQQAIKNIDRIFIFSKVRNSEGKYILSCGVENQIGFDEDFLMKLKEKPELLEIVLFHEALESVTPGETHSEIRALQKEMFQEDRNLTHFIHSFNLARQLTDSVKGGGSEDVLREKIYTYFQNPKQEELEEILASVYKDKLDISLLDKLLEAAKKSDLDTMPSLINLLYRELTSGSKDAFVRAEIVLEKAGLSDFEVKNVIKVMPKIFEVEDKKVKGLTEAGEYFLGLLGNRILNSENTKRDEKKEIGQN